MSESASINIKYLSMLAYEGTYVCSFSTMWQVVHQQIGISLLLTL